MESVSTNGLLTGRTVLIAPSATHELTVELERDGARVLNWPQVEISAPYNYFALDEAIDNLFGYNWIIFRNNHAVKFFLGRFYQLGHETSELDSLRICAIGAATTDKLEAAQIHVDLVAVDHKAEAVLTALEKYVGGPNSLRALNLLIPRAVISADPLPLMLENAEARVDVVVAYRTAAANDSALAQLNALLAGGGIDCVAFSSSSGVEEFAELFDTNDLEQLLSDVTISCINATVAQRAADLGLRVSIVAHEGAIPKLAAAIASRVV